VNGSPTRGTLAGVFGAAVAGVATGASFTYSEVGNFGLAANAVYDSTFTAVDQTSDCVVTSSSNTLDVNGEYGCNIGSTAIPLASGFGRFIPDHFDTAILFVAGVPMMCPTGLTCPSNASGANGMVYSGQPFTAQVTAKNSGSVTTANYQSPYATAVTLSAWNAAGSSTAPTSGALANTSIFASAFASGVANTALPTYALPAYTGIPTIAPTDFYVRAVDSDLVTSLRTTSIEAGLKVAYGQVRVPNVYGSELLPLKLVAVAQYYSATGWTASITDSVTTLTLASSYVVGTGTTSPTPITGTMSGGKLNFILSKPGVKGVATIDPAVPGYLQKIPGMATFGVYKGTNEFIYQREAY
jgi:MSHA biogenesis protein MshQ